MNWLEEKGRSEVSDSFISKNGYEYFLLDDNEVPGWINKVIIKRFNVESLILSASSFMFLSPQKL